MTSLENMCRVACREFGSILAKCEGSKDAWFSLKRPLEDVAKECRHDPEQNIQVLESDGECVIFGLHMLMSELAPCFIHEDDKLHPITASAGPSMQVGRTGGVVGGATTGGWTLLCSAPAPGQGGSLFHDVDLCEGGQGAK